MPRIAFTPENKSQDFTKYPKLTLQHGDKARIILIEPEPLFEFVHALSQIKLDGANRPIMTERKRKDGSTYEEPETDFLGYWLCPGNIDTLLEKGLDPAGCPACAVAKESVAVEPPRRRFATHILTYALQPGSWNLATPMQVQTLAWVFSDRIFDQIIDLQHTWGDLRKHDLRLGPCESKQFQRYEIAVLPTAEWLGSEERKKLVVETYKSNQCEDLRSLLGREADPSMLKNEAETALYRYNLAFKGGVSQQENTSSDVSSALDIDGLLGGDAVPEVPADTTPAPSPAQESPAAVESDPVPVAPTPEPAPEPVPEASSNGEKAASLDDIDAILDALP